MSIFDRFKPSPKPADDIVPLVDEAGHESPAALAPVDPTPVEPGEPGDQTVAADQTMPLPAEEIATGLAAAAAMDAAASPVAATEVLSATAPPSTPSGPLAPERITDPDDMPFLGRRALIIPDHHGDPMESMGNIFDVAILLAVGFLVVSLSSFGLSDLLGKGDVTIVKNPGTKGMELVTKKNGVIQRLRTTTSQAEGVGAAIGTVYKLENGEIVWVPGVPGARGSGTGTGSGAGIGAGTGIAPGTASPQTFAPSGSSVQSGTIPQGGISADGPSLP